MFEACGNCKKNNEAWTLYEDMKYNKIDADKVTLGTYFQAIISGHDEATKYFHTIASKPQDMKEEDQAELISMAIENIYYETSFPCPNPACEYVIREEEIMTEWEKSMNSYTSGCPSCKKQSFVPYFKLYNWFSPHGS